MEEDYGKICLGKKEYDFTDKSIEFKYRIGWLHDCFVYAMNENRDHQDIVRATFGKLIEDLDLLELNYDIIDDEEYRKRLVDAMLKINRLLKTQKHTLDAVFEGYNRLRNEVKND